MALATLYSRAFEANDHLPACHGFIIDHKVRPESTDEAQWVAEQLHQKCKYNSPFRVPLQLKMSPALTSSHSWHAKYHHPIDMAGGP